MITDYTAYFDESYTHPPQPRVYTIAGYISLDVRWKKFRQEWRKQLSSENIDSFHMVDFQACKPPYGDWSQEKRISFLQSLHSIIHRRTIQSFATTVDLDEFETLTEEQKAVLGSPHVYAAVNCMKAIGFWTAQNIINYPIAYVFERGSAHEKELNRLFNEGLLDVDHSFFRLGSLTHKDKRESVPLQAADILAYETLKEVERRLTITNPRPVRESIKNLGRVEADWWVYCERYTFLQSFHDHAKRRAGYPGSKVLTRKVGDQECLLDKVALGK